MRAALYARVSSDLQEEEKTIQSQLEALKEYAMQHDYTLVQEFIDDGYSGATLARPGLDRLRDALESGDFDLLLIHSPDRLARKAIYQGILLEEFQNHGIRVEFLNFQVDDSPEGQMLLGIQGLFAEYERAKITERTRRGRLHKARQGAIVVGIRPYGYRYVKRDGERPPALIINEEEATTVQMMFRWLVEEGLSVRKIAKRLNELGIPGTRGGQQWYSSVVGRILSSELYAGRGHYNKRRQVEPERYQNPSAYRRNPKSSYRARPREEWLPFPAPAIVDRSTWEQAQLQLKQNSLHSPRNNKLYQYLLKGLLRCSSCGRPLTGQSQNGHRYYRHNRGETPSLLEACSLQARYHAESLESLVWEAISGALQNPKMLAQECQRRLSQSQSMVGQEGEEKQLTLALKRVKSQEDRLIDAYKNEVIDLPRLKEEMGKLKARREQLERQRQDLDRAARHQADAADALERLDAFCQRVAKGLQSLTFEERQKLLRLLVDRIVVGRQSVRIEGIIPLDRPNMRGVLRPTVS